MTAILTFAFYFVVVSGIFFDAILFIAIAHFLVVPWLQDLWAGFWRERP